MTVLNGQLPKAKYESSLEKKGHKTMIEHGKSIYEQQLREHKSKAKRSLKQSKNIFKFSNIIVTASNIGT